MKSLSPASLDGNYIMVAEKMRKWITVIFSNVCAMEIKRGRSITVIKQRRRRGMCMWFFGGKKLLQYF